MNAIRSLVIAVVAAVALGPLTSRAAVDFGFFYDELSPYGDWVEVDDYGYCFQPRVDAGWRPYTDGYWADSDEGWLWVSNEPYGWATYHYGRWANVRGRGWIWVPGYEWGPGWVSWRESDDYIGWAPLPPQVAYRPQTGIRFGISFGFGDVGPGCYNFIRPRYFGYDRYRDYVLPYDRNVDIIQQTTNITNITNVVNNNRTVIYNGGPNRDFIRARSERPVRRLQIEREPANLTAAQLRERRLRNELNGDRYRVVAPEVQRGNAKPKKVAAHVAKNQIDDGYARISDRAKADAVRQRIREQANDPKNQKQVAAKAKDEPKRAGGKNADSKRDEILKRQAEFENRPKTKQQQERAAAERANQDRAMRQQADKAGNSNKPKSSDAKPKNENRPRNAEKPRNEPKPQQADKPAKKADKPQAERRDAADRPAKPKNNDNVRPDKPKAQKRDDSPKPKKQSDSPSKKNSGGDRPKAEKKERASGDGGGGRKNKSSKDDDKKKN